MKAVIETQYYTCGSLQEPEGLTFHARTHAVTYDESGAEVERKHNSGCPTEGYLEKVLSEKEFTALLKKCETQGRYGFVDKKGLAKLDAEAKEFNTKKIEYHAEANRINFKLAQRDAEAIGEDHEAVFTSKHPKVSEDVKAMLFADIRLAKTASTKKKSKPSV